MVLTYDDSQVDDLLLEGDACNVAVKKDVKAEFDMIWAQIATPQERRAKKWLGQAGSLRLLFLVREPRLY